MMISESITVKNIHKFADRYGLMRQSTGMYLMWKVCEYFQPNLLLEIGFSAGQTFGLLIEATPTDAKANGQIAAINWSMVCVSERYTAATSSMILLKI